MSTTTASLTTELVQAGKRLGTPCDVVSDVELFSTRALIEARYRRKECRANLWECLQRPHARASDRDAWRALRALIPAPYTRVMLWPNYPIGGAVRCASSSVSAELLAEASWTELLVCDDSGEFLIFLSDHGLVHFAGEAIGAAGSYYGIQRLVHCFG